MRALFDTNILLDIGLARKPFAATALSCFLELNVAKQHARVAPHALATFYYIVAQAFSVEHASTAVADLVATSEIVPFDHNTAQRAVELNFDDFEDAMIAAAAEAADMECIVTRNGSDFKKSPVPVLSPEAFLEKIRS